MCNKVTYDAIQVLGGSGYMRDYACERLARDGRITTIYEGTSQLQIVAAVRSIANGTAERFIDQLAHQSYDLEIKDLLEKLSQGTEQLKKATTFVKQQGTEYMDLYGRALVDMAVDLIIGYLFCGQASTNVNMEAICNNENQKIPMKKRKAMLARRFVTKNMPKLTALSELICTGDKSTFTDYGILIGPVIPEA